MIMGKCYAGNALNATDTMQRSLQQSVMHKAITYNDQLGITVKISDGRSVVTNGYAKSNFERLRIDKALGF